MLLKKKTVNSCRVNIEKKDPLPSSQKGGKGGGTTFGQARAKEDFMQANSAEEGRVYTSAIASQEEERKSFVTREGEEINLKREGRGYFVSGGRRDFSLAFLWKEGGRGDRVVGGWGGVSP